MKNKLYFGGKDEEYCFSKQYWIDRMKEAGETEMKAFLAKAVSSPDYFFCQAVDEMGEKGSCGKLCEDYEPRNGRSGICKHNGRLYYPYKEVLIKSK